MCITRGTESTNSELGDNLMLNLLCGTLYIVKLVFTHS